MARSKCRPCITISTIWKIGKIHFRHFMEDIRAFSGVQEYSCKMYYSENSIISPEIQTVKKIREIAATNYDPIVAKNPEEVEPNINQILKENV